MRWVFALFSLLIFTSTACAAAGSSVLYEIDNQQYEGYFILPAPNSPMVLLIHDWDGLTDYEKKRADMLAEMGYAVFAADLFGKGVFPESQEERRRLTEALKKDRTRMRALLRRPGARVA